MTDPKPCLPGCRCKCGDLLHNGTHHASVLGALAFDPESHAPGCPNAPADVSEPLVQAPTTEQALESLKEYLCELEAKNEALRAEVESKDACLRAALSDATLCDWLVAAIEGGDVSDFAQSFAPVRAVLDLRAEVARLRDVIVKGTHACDANDAALRAEVERLKRQVEQLEVFKSLPHWTIALREKEGE